jgi:putative hemolysin
MRGVPGKEKLLLKMHECPGQLNQRLIKTAVGIGTLQPQMLEHIVGFVVGASVEEGDESSIFRGSFLRAQESPAIQPEREPLIFFHSQLRSRTLDFAKRERPALTILRPRGRPPFRGNRPWPGPCPARIAPHEDRGMKAPTAYGLGLLAVLLASGSALFSAFETALFSLQSHELERLRRGRSRYAATLSALLSTPRRLLGVILMVDACLNVPLIVLCHYFLSVREPGAFVFWIRAFVLLGIVTFLCDLLPKIAALFNPYRLIRPAVKILPPLVALLEKPAGNLHRFSERLAKWITRDRPPGGASLGEEEMETLVELGAEEGALQPSESAIIQEILRLGNKRVRDCMTPRVDAVYLPDDLSRAEAIERLRSCRYRRVPVYGQTPDEILGILEVRPFLEHPSAHYTELLIPPSFVPESMNALDLLRAFLRKPQSLAVVVDEHGGTEGIITRADLVEEILADALPGGASELYIEPLGSGILVASGSARLADVADALETTLDIPGIETIGGLAFTLQGQIPRPGTVLRHQQLQITVRRTARKRVDEVLVELVCSATPSPGED